jgi:hypothetical protein
MALAAYNKQMNDHTMADMVVRIRKRAMERAGTLLNQLQRERGRRTDKPDVTGHTRLKATLAEAGITPNEARTMMAVANVPKPQFEETVERDRPATVKELAAAGRLWSAPRRHFGQR